MVSNGTKGPLPVVLLCGLIAIAVITVCVVAWHEFAGGSSPVPDKQVHAGMYDFRKEAQNGNLGRRTEPR